MVALLAMVAGQDVEPAEGSDGTDGRWRIARKVAYDRVISTVDPETRRAHKTVHQRRDGFKANVVVEPTTGLLTATRLTKAAGPESADGTVGTDLLATDSTLTAQQWGAPRAREGRRDRRRWVARHGEAGAACRAGPGRGPGGLRLRHR